MNETEVLKKILRILESTTLELLDIVKELKSINTKDSDSYKVEISEKGKRGSRHQDN